MSWFKWWVVGNLLCRPLKSLCWGVVLWARDTTMVGEVSRVRHRGRVAILSAVCLQPVPKPVIVWTWTQFLCAFTTGVIFTFVGIFIWFLHLEDWFDWSHRSQNFSSNQKVLQRPLLVTWFLQLILERCGIGCFGESEGCRTCKVWSLGKNLEISSASWSHECNQFQIWTCFYIWCVTLWPFHLIYPGRQMSGHASWPWQRLQGLLALFVCW